MIKLYIKARFLPVWTFFLLLMMSSGGFIYGQTAERLETILNTPEITYALAASVVLPAAGLIGEDSAMEAAFAEARARNYLPREVSPEGAIRLGDLSFLIMQAFGMKSGFMYALFPGPRYAYRELVYRRLIQGRNDPALKISGARFLRIIDRVLEFQGE